MVVFGAVEDDCATFECIGVFRIRQISLTKFLRDDAGLHDSAVEKISLQNDEAGILQHRVFGGVDDIIIVDPAGAAILAEGAAVDGLGLFANELELHQLVDDGRYAAGTVKFLAKIFSGWL